MDPNESIRKLERLMEKEPEHARELATELEALLPHLPNGKSRQIAEIQVKPAVSKPKAFAS